MRISILLLSAFLLSCGSSKSTTEDFQNYVVSFYSPGNGINFNAYQSYTSFLDRFKPTVSYEKIYWGKEGEIDLCIDLSVLNKKDQNRFIEESKTVIGDADRVQTFENQTCKTNRKPLLDE